jgi:hypothetical protein
MKYHSTIDNITISVDTDAHPPTLSLTNPEGAVLMLDGRQAGLMKLVRRGMTDIMDAVHKTARDDDRTR